MSSSKHGAFKFHAPFPNGECIYIRRTNHCPKCNAWDVTQNANKKADYDLSAEYEHQRLFQWPYEYAKGVFKHRTKA